MVIKEMIVVEGKDDTVAIKRAVEADTIETGGSAINQRIIAQIKRAQSIRGVIIFTDPDYPGEKIRKTIAQAVPNCLHAFLPREKAKDKRGKVGVEHASPEEIIRALQAVRRPADHINSEQQGGDEVHHPLFSSVQELYPYGLVGQAHSQALRKKIGDRLSIGHNNAKQLLQRINAFRITREEWESAYQAVLQELEDEKRDCNTVKNKGNH